MPFAKQSFSQDEPDQPPPGQVTSDERFLAILQASADIFWMLTPLGALAETSPGWLTFTGQTEEEAHGLGWLKAFHPTDQANMEAMLARAVTSGRTAEGKCHLRKHDGSYYLMEISAIPVRTTGGRLREFIICGSDVTRLDLTQHLSEAQVQFVFKAGIGIWDRDILTNQLVWTDQQKALFGLSPTTPIDYEHFLLALHPDDRVRIQELMDYCLEQRIDYNTEFRVIWPDGSTHWLTSRARSITDTHGKTLRLIGITMDITELKRAEADLRENTVGFSQFVASNIIGITVADLDGHIREANDAFLSLVGYTQEDVAMGRMNWMALNPPEYLELDLQALKEILETGVFQPFEKEYLTRDGRRVPVLLGGTRLMRERSEPLMINFILDLTARKEIEQQKDLFLGMTSHELKTPLAALKGMLQLLQRRLKRMLNQAGPVAPEWQTFFDDLASYLATSIQHVNLQNRLINDLLDVSRITTNTLKLLLERSDLVKLVSETVENLRVTAPERTLLLDLPEDTTVPVQIDRDRISQVITNYVTNALRYSPPTEPVQIGLTVQGDMARVWVRDKGPGLTLEAQQELWQRFHQLKGIPVQSGSGKGLGLGLYISQILIKQHQGEVGVESTPGAGSTFWFTLPVVA